MKIKTPPGVNMIIEKLTGHGFEAYAVGGCVRDSILMREPDDWDITTSAKPEEVKGLFSRTVDTGLAHGTVTVLIGSVGYEVTTYRIDGEYKDGRHPSGVTFTASLLEDLKRRDFTINAMAYSDAQGLIDPFGGMEDLQKHRIRCVGDPRERFGEDALRILRAVRFSAQLGFEIEEGTKRAIESLSGTLEKISAERVQVEIVKLLVSPRPGRWCTAWETGITAVIMPEFDRMMETPQNTPHHMYTVGEHTLKVLAGIRADKVMRLSALLHDIGKPDTRTTDTAGVDHFKGHSKVGQELAVKILKRLKLDNDTISKVGRLIYWHDIRPKAQAAAVRKVVHQVGEDIFPALLELQYADTMAKSMYRRDETVARIKAVGELYRQIVNEGQCISLKQLRLTGKDLIALGVSPGPQIGDILNQALKQVLDEPEKNEREYLMGFAQKVLQHHEQ